MGTWVLGAGVMRTGMTLEGDRGARVPCTWWTGEPASRGRR